MITETVAVVEQRTAGLWFNFVVQRLWAAKVIGLDPKTHLLQLAHQYGATDTINTR